MYYIIADEFLKPGENYYLIDENTLEFKKVSYEELHELQERVYGLSRVGNGVVKRWGKRGMFGYYDVTSSAYSHKKTILCDGKFCVKARFGLNRYKLVVNGHKHRIGVRAGYLRYDGKRICEAKPEAFVMGYVYRFNQYIVMRCFIQLKALQDNVRLAIFINPDNGDLLDFKFDSTNEYSVAEADDIKHTSISARLEFLPLVI